METVIVQLVTAIGPTGVLAWYCYYVTSKMLPGLVSEFRNETRLIREESRAERDSHVLLVRELSAAVQKMVGNCEAARGN
ncbi:MAG: hypothetical protein IMZ55_15460 [Acidobacteria bacterium]|nr:hypothetical protein [Acidobacteriota bacterium]